MIIESAQEKRDSCTTRFVESKLECHDLPEDSPKFELDLAEDDEIEF